MATSKDDERRGGNRNSCAECGAARAGDQRYCLECGARHGPLPGAIAAQLAPLLQSKTEKWATAGAAAAKGAAKTAGAAAAGAAVGAATAATAAAKSAGAGAKAATGAKAADADEGWPHRLSSYMPSPRAAVVAVICMLGLGVILGSATSQLAQSAGLSSIILEVPPPPAPEPEEVEEEPEEVEVAETEPEAAPASVPAEVAPEPEPAPTPAPVAPPAQPFVPEEPAGLPEVKHLFVIMLGENGYEETFGAASTAPYLSKELPAQGELLPNYFAVTKGDLANQIALISGQGPTLETAADCPNYGDVVPGTLSATDQVEGNGCVYPATTPTLPAQLQTAKLKWKAYVEDSGNGVASGQPATCRHPLPGTPDPSHAPLPGDAYLTWRNPFVYFHAIVDSPECAANDVGLEQLLPDLKKKAEKVPALSYIVPNACHSGGEAPCEPGRLAGPAAVEEFLKTVVPEIQKSAAYQEGGLIAITSSQARQVSALPGFIPDTSSCCVSPVYPNLPPEAPPAEAAAGPVKTTGGGGKVGMLLLSSFVEPGTVNEANYNHFSFLITIEELFELERIGYAAEPALIGFEEEVFNAAAEEEELPKPKPRPFWLSRRGSAAR